MDALEKKLDVVTEALKSLAGKSGADRPKQPGWDCKCGTRSNWMSKPYCRTCGKAASYTCLKACGYKANIHRLSN